jgi:hypothetical protein
MLWAWERPEDLRGLGTRAGVAFLAQTMTLRDGGLAVTPRRQPLLVDPATQLTAVTRIESTPGSLADDTLAVAAGEIARTRLLPRVTAVQVDFDAVASERAMYARLLRLVRDRVPPSVPVSMTALASWCAGDRWLDELPVDEAVAMLFRLGPVNAPFLEIGRSPSVASAACNGVGVSLDEPLALRAGGRRVYVFNPEAWTPGTVAAALERAR